MAAATYIVESVRDELAELGNERLADALGNAITLLGGDAESSGAKRTAKWRANKKASRVTSPVTSQTPSQQASQEAKSGVVATPNSSSATSEQEKQSDSKPISESSSSLTLLSSAELVPSSSAGARHEKRHNKRHKRVTRDDGLIAAVWRAYSVEYQRRHNQIKPTWNAKVGGQLAHFVTRVPAEDACGVAAFYARSNNEFYIRQGHSIGCMLANAEQLHTEYLAGVQVTASAARRIDHAADREQRFDALRARLAAEDAAEEAEALNA